MHLMNRAGPLLVGALLEVKSGGCDYIPTFHVHCLLTTFPDVSLTLISPLRGYVTLVRHRLEFPKVVEQFKPLVLLPYEGDLGLEQVLDAYRKYAKAPYIHYQPYVYEDMVLMASWCGHGGKISEILREAERDMKTWPPGGAEEEESSLEEWLQELEVRARDRGALQAIYEQELDALKVRKLPVRQLIP
jgi:hypothetical protein